MNKKIYILSAFIVLSVILGALFHIHHQHSRYQFSETADGMKNLENSTSATENKEKNTTSIEESGQESEESLETENLGVPNWFNECMLAWKELPHKAEAGDAEAQNKLAHMYYDNYNLDCAGALEINQHDPHKALELFLKSAKQGHVNSMYMLGLIYLEGPSFYDYPEQDSKKAEKWFLKAAMKGDSYSSLNLARLYAQGLGVPKNLKKAREWALRALKQNPNNTSPNYYLGLIELDEKQYEKAAKSFQNCTGEKKDDSQWKTHECYHADYQLSKLYEQGIGVKKDLNKAAELYNNARQSSGLAPITPSENIETIAMKRLWFNAVYKKNPAAQYELGRRYRNGSGGLEKDEVRATEWYSRAAEQGHPDALYALAMMGVEDHRGYPHCDIDWIPEQVALLERAAQKGHSGASYELAKIYEKGAYVVGDGGFSNRCLGWGWRYNDVIIARDAIKAKYYFEKSGKMSSIQ